MIDAAKIERRADELLQLMRSSRPAEEAVGIIAGASGPELDAILRAFQWHGWGEAKIAVPQRGHEILNVIGGLPEDA